MTGAGTVLAGMVLSIAYVVLLERAALGFRRLRPRTSSIYDKYFWRHERLGKLLAPNLPVLDGTPFKTLMNRLLGMRVGRAVLDDGAGCPEKTLVTISDGCQLNQGSTLQAHSLEDGGFSSDHIILQAGSSIGIAAFAHYGINLGAQAHLHADAFLMKGAQVGPLEHWIGNPAEPAT